MNVMKAVCKY